MIFSEFHINIKIRIIETLLSKFVSNMIFPFMAIYLAVNFGPALAGLQITMNVIISISVGFIGGYIGDQYGRKNVILFAEMTRFLAFFTMMICNSPWFESPLITFFMMTVNNICSVLAGPANQAMLIDVCTPAQRKDMYTLLYWVNNISISIGGIVGAVFIKNYLFELFILLTCVAFIVVLLVIFFKKDNQIIKDKPHNFRQHMGNMFGNYLLVFKDKIFILFVLAGTLILSMEFQLINYIAIRLDSDIDAITFFQWELDGSQVMALLRSENTILAVLLVFFIRRVIKNFSDNKILIYSCLLYTIGYGVISYSNNLTVLLVFTFILTVGEVCRVPVEQSYMSLLPRNTHRSSYMAVYGFKYNLATLVASLTITISHFLPPMIVTLIITVIGLIGTLIYLSLLTDLNKKKEDTHIDLAK